MIETLTKINAVRLWNGTVIDLNAISGIESPVFNRAGYGTMDKCEIYCIIKSNKGDIKITEYPHTRDGYRFGISKYYMGVLVINTSKGVESCNNISWDRGNSVSWKCIDDTYNINPKNEDVLFYMEFKNRIDTLIKYWNDNKAPVELYKENV